MTEIRIMLHCEDKLDSGRYRGGKGILGAGIIEGAKTCNWEGLRFIDRKVCGWSTGSVLMGSRR